MLGCEDEEGLVAGAAGLQESLNEELPLGTPSPSLCSPAMAFCCFSESTLFCDVQLVCVSQAKCGRERGRKGGGKTEGEER